MVYIHKGGESHSPLNYDQLAELYRASKKDAVAAIQWDMLSPADQRLAKQVHDIYATGLTKSAKPKKKKKVDPFQPIIPDIKPGFLTSVVKSEKQVRNEMLDADLNSPDAHIREAAIAYLEDRRKK